MSFQVGIGSLGGTVFFQVGFCTPLQNYEVDITSLEVSMIDTIACSYDLNQLIQEPTQTLAYFVVFLH